MTRSASPKLGAYTGLAALGLLAALALGLPELVAVVAPFVVVSAVGLLAAREPAIDASLTLERERVLEGDEIEVSVTLESRTPVARLELFLRLPEDLAVAEGDNPVALRLGADEPHVVRLRLRAERWGAYRVGQLFLRASDRFGLFRYETRLDRRAPLKAYPSAETARALLRPLETQVFAGNQVARQKGEGIEFSDLRPFLAGDRIRRINWRASARRGELWVNERHAERNADVVIFLDSFTEARRGGETTLDLSVRAAAGLAARYLKEKDRVGFVSFGGVLNWLLPGTGLVQLYRIVDAVLDTQIVLNYAWKDLEVIPRRTLPPQALVLALSPLLDDRAARALLDLRARGFDLAIIEVSPVPYVTPGKGELNALAYRIWELRREALRGRYQRAGIPVAVWDDASPLASAIEEVRAFRRYAQRARG